MSDIPPVQAPAPAFAPTSTPAFWVYILYFAQLLFGITAIIGVIMAYVVKADAPEWLQTHYVYQIHTFWKGLLYAIIGCVLIPVLIGFLVLLVVFVWWIVRSAKGINELTKARPIPDPQSWGF